MFIEPKLGENKTGIVHKNGWIEVICGSMFSGKTEELLRRLNRAFIARQRVEIYKPAIDTRYHHQNVVSHNANSIASTPVQFANDILLLAGNCDVVGIDEAQFFDKDIHEVCNKLANAGKRVVIAGLDMDFNGKPFGPISGLLAIAEYVTKVHAICIKCGDIANYSYRKVESQRKILLGETDSYEARCRPCFNKGSAAEQKI